MKQADFIKLATKSSEQNDSEEVKTGWTSSMVRIADVNVTLYQVSPQSIPCVLRILFVEIVLVGSEGMTEQNLM